MSNSAEVVAIGDFPAYAGLLDHLGIERASAAASAAFLLLEDESGLELRPPFESDRRGIRAEFPPDKESQAIGARGPLAKAFGKRVHTILDGTAGLGGDAYRLAAAGYRVRAWERHPALFALASSGWGAAVAAGRIAPEIIARFSLQWGDAAEALAGFDGLDLGAYFDPMYPAPRKQSALPKRPLQVLRQLLDGDTLAPETVQAARARFSRVVVKRPHHAEPLIANPNFEVSTKLVRFDVYLNPERMGPSTA